MRDGIYVDVKRMMDLTFLYGDWFNPEYYSNLDGFLEGVVEITNEAIKAVNEEIEYKGGDADYTLDDLSITFPDYNEDYRNFVELNGIDEGLWDYLNLDSDEQDMFAAFVSSFGMQLDFQATWSACQDANNGKWDSEKEFAWHIFEECYSDMYKLMDDANWISYFDIDQFSYDLFISDYTTEDRYVFSRNW